MSLKTPAVKRREQCRRRYRVPISGSDIEFRSRSSDRTQSFTGADDWPLQDSRLLFPKSRSRFHAALDPNHDGNHVRYTSLRGLIRPKKVYAVTIWPSMYEQTQIDRKPIKKYPNGRDLARRREKIAVWGCENHLSSRFSQGKRSTWRLSHCDLAAAPGPHPNHA